MVKMLPSMPLLMTPMKELGDDSSGDSSEESPFNVQLEGSNGKLDPSSEKSSKLEKNNPVLIDNENIQEDFDKISDKSQTPDKRSSSEPTSAQKKKKKTQHKKTLAALTPDTGESLEHSAQNFAEAYFQKAKSILSEEKWGEFVQELVDFEGKTDKNPTELYKKMEVLLSPHSELIDEFLAFLLPHQALQVNRFIPYLMLVKMKEFFRKLNILLLKRQSLLVYSALESLAASPNATLADVKAAMLPLLKSSPLLTNMFLELMPGERPPDSMMTDFEQVDFKDDSLFETVMVPDCPDPYGNDNCICPCHTTQKNRHCVSCGIKYLNGRVYIQYGKVLRPAKVTFNGNKHLDLRKWEEDKCRSRRRIKSLLSPTCMADSEDDCGVKKSPRTPRIRTQRTKVCKKVILGGNKEGEVLEGIFPLTEPHPNSIGKNLQRKLIVDCETKLNPMEENEFDEVLMENECNTEEDEEEELNKCVHSENESSLEGEDLSKELELVNDCSFEDEDMDDFENDVVSECSDLNLKTSVEDIPSKSESMNGDLITSCVELDDKNNLTEVELKNDVSNVDSPKQENVIDDCNKKRKVLNLTSDELNICKRFEEIIESQSIQNKSGHSTGTEMISQIKVEKVEDIDMEVKLEAEEVDLGIDYIKSDPDEGSSENVTKANENSATPGEGESSTREWTREEDKIILQTFQHENGLEQTFETASLQLPNRSKDEIQERFEVLLKLLKEMISDKSNDKEKV